MTNNYCVHPNGQPFGKVVRREYRLLSDDERNRYIFPAD